MTEESPRAPYAGKHPGDLKPPTAKQKAYHQYLSDLCRQNGVGIRNFETITRHEYALAIGFMRNDLGIMSNTVKANARRVSRAARAMAKQKGE